MKAAVVALGVLLRFAVVAQATEAVRPPPATPAPAATNVIPIAAPAPVKVDAGAPKPLPPHEAAKPQVDDAHREGAHARTCFNAAQTRENVATHRLAEPFRALRVGGQQGEALRAKLCRWKQDQWIYEISVLRRDGRIVRLYMNAQNGQSVGALDSNERH